MINDQSLQWGKEIQYLGVLVSSAKKFTTSLQHFRKTFYGALNGILLG